MTQFWRIQKRKGWRECKKFRCIVAHRVEPPNKGQVGTLTNVHYSEVVLYWGVSAKNHLFCILGHTKQMDPRLNVVFVSMCLIYLHQILSFRTCT